MVGLTCGKRPMAGSSEGHAGVGMWAAKIAWLSLSEASELCYVPNVTERDQETLLAAILEGLREF